ncbi:MAG: IS1595 family transposase [Rhodomicrobium sp.]
MSILSDLHFHNEEAAYAWVEARLWPDGPQCPRCKGTERVGKLQGKSTRIGTYKCYECKKPFTVKVGTIFEDSHIKLNVWLQAIHLICSSKKGISSNQLHRTLKITLKSAWFLGHRIREAMRTGSLAVPTPLGGEGKIVEADETFIGKKDGVVKSKKARGYAHKQAALSLVERGGDVRSFHIDNAGAANIYPIIDKNLRFESTLMTDEARFYETIGRSFNAHFTVEHRKGEYVRGDCHTNTLEGYYSIFKRGMKGIYQHCAERHLHRYLAEFDFRYNNRIARCVDDEARTAKALQGVKGKRLTYKAADRKEANDQIH